MIKNWIKSKFFKEWLHINFVIAIVLKSACLVICQITQISRNDYGRFILFINKQKTHLKSILNIRNWTEKKSEQTFGIPWITQCSIFMQCSVELIKSEVTEVIETSYDEFKGLRSVTFSSNILEPDTKASTRIPEIKFVIFILSKLPLFMIFIKLQ